MNALIVDATSSKLAVVLIKDALIFSSIGSQKAKRHASEILCVIDDLLTQCGLHAIELDVVATITGPGSFTGIRVGVATCNAIAHASKAKRIEITSLESILYGIDSGMALLDCNNDNYYALEKNYGTYNYFAISKSDLDGFKTEKHYITEFDIDKTIKVFKEKYAKNEFVDVLTPFYIKKSSAEKYE
ncbi:MAG: tRNA (adenosine(37)-N6)-threonylcarbamoyltransferase complex dimerization subunit type 1 TsaB [Christensenellaceae bacterium]|jgi:tRNA A37 threonylcarbamoyladenosine modification protein TsaB|nr:tRNA (adenosine(37)-N6)-threonylcarbamoyltransferase complex dimerization subunit type 1 TsaB [Christensenellaceae bacterium]